MAKNQCWSKGGGCQIELNEGDAAYFGAALDSGEAAEWSEFTGVAEIDFTAAADGTMTRCTGHQLTVTPQDDGGAQAVAVGDPLYYHDTTGVIDKAVNGGQFLGWAMTAITVQAGATLICILLEQDPDYTRFMDEQLLEFGDGAAGKGGAGDVRIWFELDDQDFYIQNELEGSRTYIDSGLSTGRVDIQNHLYLATGGEITTVRISPRLTVADANNAIVALHVTPSADDTVTGAYLIGVNSIPYLRGDTGDWSGPIRAFQAGFTDDMLPGRTVAGPLIMYRGWINAAATVTNGVYGLYLEQRLDATAWTAAIYVDDDGGELGDLGDTPGNAIAVISAEVGGTEGWIFVYDGYNAT